MKRVATHKRNKRDRCTALTFSRDLKAFSAFVGFLAHIEMVRIDAGIALSAALTTL